MYIPYYNSLLHDTLLIGGAALLLYYIMYVFVYYYTVGIIVYASTHPVFKTIGNKSPVEPYVTWCPSTNDGDNILTRRLARSRNLFESIGRGGFGRTHRWKIITRYRLFRSVYIYIGTYVRVSLGTLCNWK